MLVLAEFLSEVSSILFTSTRKHAVRILNVYNQDLSNPVDNKGGFNFEVQQLTGLTF